MKILYLHGLESSVGGPKVEYLESLGHKVHAPEMCWDVGGNFVSIADHCAYEDDFDLIIGSSMGGYFAYELGKIFDIPVLLLNPALHSRSIEPRVEKVHEDLAADPLVFLGVGANDDVINYEKTLDILDEEAGCFFRGNYWKGDHGHRTPIDFFQKVFGNTEIRLNKIKQNA
jgi:uncharacterized protein